MFSLCPPQGVGDTPSSLTGGTPVSGQGGGEGTAIRLDGGTYPIGLDGITPPPPAYRDGWGTPHLAG